MQTCIWHDYVWSLNKKNAKTNHPIQHSGFYKLNNYYKKDNDKTLDQIPTATGPVKPARTELPQDVDVVEGCYRGVLVRDTFAASLHQKENSITGKLSFDNYEKDGISGSVTGKLQGDVLQLYYNFASEGMNSIMEVYFKYSNHKLAGTLAKWATETVLPIL
jgi:hypothetical protein